MVKAIYLHEIKKEQTIDNVKDLYITNVKSLGSWIKAVNVIKAINI